MKIDCMKKIRLLIVNILMVIITSMGLSSDSIGQNNFQEQEKINKLTFLSVKGNKIIDENGKEIALKGFHFDSFYTFRKDIYDAIKSANRDPDDINIELSKYFFSDYDIREFKHLGANVVRIGIRLWEIEDKPFSVSEKSLKHLDNTINKWGGNGIYVILDLHAAGQNDLSHNREYGNILWEIDQFQNRVIALWDIIANRYKDNPYIAGYDIINEPQAPTRESLHSFYIKTIKKIRETDKKHIIILEWDEKRQQEFYFGGKYDDSNIVYSIHFYKPGKFTNQGINNSQTGYKYPGKYGGIYWDKNQINKYFSEVLSNIDKPLFIGEFGAAYKGGGQDSFQWISDVISVLNNNGIHYTYFSYKSPMKNSLGFYQPIDNIVQRIEYLNKAIRNKKIRIDEIKEEYKKIAHTENNYESPQKLRQILIKGFILDNSVSPYQKHYGFEHTQSELYFLELC